MKSVAILYICTGKYCVLWKEFYESFEEKFLKEYHKEYFVFTDSEKIEYGIENSNIHRVEQKALDWPYSTLLRFHMFNKISEKLSEFDYIFFFNANAYAVSEITANMILPRMEKGEDICVVKHPAYRNCKPFEFPYDRNFNCKAFIPYGSGKVYVQGCLIGGTANGFLKMSKSISEKIDIDLKRNTIALWHDESYLNKYILTHKNFRLLGIEFADPISNNPHRVLIHMREKERYFNVTAVKSDPPKTQLKGINKFYNERIFSFLSKKAIFKCDYKNTEKHYGPIRAFAWGIKNCWKILF